VLIVDTGPLVAAADRTDRHHAACAKLLETATGPLVTTAMVVAEAVYLLTRELGGHAEPAFYDAIINGTLIVEPLIGQDWQRIRDLVERYADLPLGGTDASLIAIAERLGATRLATLDRSHFQIIRPVHCDAFELSPTR
jgi:uncharacterized protein